MIQRQSGDTGADRLSRLMGSTHTRIDLDAYTRNIVRLRAMVSDDVELMAVVKADAYGHGAVECGKAALAAGATILGVARIVEAITLRRLGVGGEILVLGPPNISEVNRAVEHDVMLTVGSDESVTALSTALRSHPGTLRVHLKVDTGMRRFGVLPEQAARTATLIVDNRRFELDGMFTHFSSADERDEGPTQLQIDRFDAVVDELREKGVLPRRVHLANSAGVLSGRIGSGNLVRCGIATYGLSPSAEVPVPEDFEPVMSVVSRVGRRFALREGEGVSYGLTYRATHEEELATVPIGYADGLSRDLSNLGWFSARGHRLPIRGRVCMDQTVVGNAEELVEGDGVTVIGPRPGDMTLDDAASMTGTINYELATRITARVPRVYFRGGRSVAWDHTLLGERGELE